MHTLIISSFNTSQNIIFHQRGGQKSISFESKTTQNKCCVGVSSYDEYDLGYVHSSKTKGYKVAKFCGKFWVNLTILDFNFRDFFLVICGDWDFCDHFGIYKDIFDSWFYCVILCVCRLWGRTNIWHVMYPNENTY
jgi:hypothetical protein